jgi:hypothetical protein
MSISTRCISKAALGLILINGQKYNLQFGVNRSSITITTYLGTPKAPWGLSSSIKAVRRIYVP